MKKVGLLLLTLFVSSLVIAQGIYQMWGTTFSGGASNMGILFRTDAAGNNFQVKHSFYSTASGSNPSSTTLTEYNGKFYGMTELGGNFRKGVIFEWDPATNVYTKKVDFNGSNGANPFGDLVLSGGKFYGTTFFGGYNDMGVIFEWDPATNVYTKKFEFSGPVATGAFPRGSLTKNGGKFYGTTTQGGSFYKGVIFEWDPATNVYTKKFEFDGTNGDYPQSRLRLSGGKFYGMTTNGGNSNAGVIFEWDPATNAQIKKFEFNGANGKYPFAELVLSDGKFYGATAEGGNSNFGVLFEWDPASNVYTKKIDMNFVNGYRPVGKLMLIDGKFYGATQNGGSSYSGVMFEWDPVTNIYLKKFDFSKKNGDYPYGNMALKDGKFYSMTMRGGLGDSGVIFEWDPATHVYTKKMDFNIGNGAYPSSSLMLVGDKFYGTTSTGSGNSGVIYEWDPASNVYSHKVEFAGAQGEFAMGNLTLNNGKLYGTRTRGVNNNYGFIFEWDPVTNIYTKKTEFNAVNGNEPTGNLILNNGKFYGMTQQGGSSNSGVIYEWDPVTNIYTKKFEFNGINGGYPLGSLVLKDGKFYGTTPGGGANGVGVIFEWDPVTNIYTKKIDLSNSSGCTPTGSLTLKDGKFYGMTEDGGSSGSGGTTGYGVIFEWNPATNIYSRKFNFNNNNGAGPWPWGNLALSGGKFYGMTQEGGTTNNGVIFEWDPSTNVYTKKLDFNGSNGRGPLNDLKLVPAPVAKGLPGSCITFPSVTIDNSNNTTWVPILDNDGNAVAEIKANGNNLGVITTSMFVNDAGVREDNAKRLYLDRNFTIIPQFQPSTTVDIRLYILNSEYIALKNAVSSNGLSSGINSINDIGIFKNPVNNCAPDIVQVANPVITTVTNWESDYVLSAIITSFSSFYFANKAFDALPLNLLEFKGRIENGNGLLNWKTVNEQNTSHFEIERSTNGSSYAGVGTVTSINTPGIHNYSFSDPAVSSLNAATIYYRLKQVDVDGEFTYSHVVVLSIEKDNVVLFYPNPVADKANLFVTISHPERFTLRITDNLGRVVKRQQWNLSAGSTSLSIDVKSLPKGLYYLDLKGTTTHKRLNFIRQ